MKEKKNSNMDNQLGNYYRKTGSHDFCGCEILPPPKYEIERIVIDHIVFHNEIKINGQKKQNAFVAYFAPNPYTTLPFCLNSGNAKRLAKRTWSIVVEDGLECQGRIDLLHNIPVRLCRELTRDPSDGGQVYGLRISQLDPAQEEAPRPQKKKTITEDKVDVVVEWAKKNGKTIADIEAMYEMSQPIRDALVDALHGNEDDLPE